MDNYGLLTDRKRMTRSRVYRCFYASPSPLSKQDISLQLKLSLPTVYQNINELLELGLIEYSGAQASRGGRPAMQMQMVADARCAVGIYISLNRVYFALTNLRSELLAHSDISHELTLLSDEYNRFLAQELERFLDANGVRRDKLLGVGICLSGIIDPENNSIFYAPPLGLRNVSMQGLIDAIPYPVHPENDASSGGFAEWFIGAEGDNLVFLSLAAGVGGAVFVNGGSYPGSNQRSGEFGHMCIEKGGLRCTCGKRGCLEAYCSSSRISSDLGISLDEFFRRLGEGDERLQALWDDYLEHLAVGIHNIRMAMDCRIVLGGMMAEYLGPYLPRLRHLVAEADPFCNDADYLSLGHFSGKGPLLGSALYFVKNFLESNI